MATVKHLDELSDFYLRDFERIKPGDRLVFGHLPTLANPDLEDSRVRADGSLVTVTRAAVVEAGSLFKTPRIYEGSDRLSEVIFYTVELPDWSPETGLCTKLHETNRFAADAGVTRYDQERSGGWYNSTNFTVMLSDLEAAGIEVDLSPSAAYLERQEEFNKQVHSWGLSDDEGFYAEDEPAVA